MRRRSFGRVAAAAVVVLAACAEEEPLRNPEPLTVESPFSYPLELWDTGTEGETMVMVRVTDSGGVDSVYVLESSGHLAFDSAAAEGARQLRFAPARRGDERIAMWVRLPVRFRQPGDSVRAAGGGAE